MIAKKAAHWTPERGEIIFIEHSSQAGDEIPGLHPMLVCSTRIFNERTGIVIGFPMTHAEFHADNPFARSRARQEGRHRVRPGISAKVV
jgi:mRNA interferase MazF